MYKSYGYASAAGPLHIVRSAVECAVGWLGGWLTGLQAGWLSSWVAGLLLAGLAGKRLPGLAWLAGWLAGKRLAGWAGLASCDASLLDVSWEPAGISGGRIPGILEGRYPESCGTYASREVWSAVLPMVWDRYSRGGCGTRLSHPDY